MPILLDDLDPNWLYWFTGFFDGEGCFGAYVVKSRYVVAGLVMGQIESMVLQEIADKFQCGKIQAMGKGHGYQWRVYKMDDLVNLFIPLFERYPLHTRKAQEYPIWKALIEGRRAIEVSYRNGPPDAARVKAEGKLLRELRAIRRKK